MARRIFLHIGTMKSATSYIQGLFELNMEHLETVGIRWIPGDLRYPAIRELLGRAQQATDLPESWSALTRAIRRFPGDVIVSNELLAPISPRYIRRLLKLLPDVEAHVVITARDLARVLPSHWQTTLKNGKTQPWSEFAGAVCTDAEEPLPPADAQTREWFWLRHDVAAMAARWADFVPLERITLVTVPPSGADPTTVGRRFGTVVGVDVDGLVQPEYWSNPSLGAHSAELMRRLNEQMSAEEITERRFGFRLAFGGPAVAGRSYAEPAIAMTQDQHDWVSRRARAMVDELQRTGIRVEGDLADLLPAASPVPGAVDPSDTTERELFDAASQALVAMAKVTAELRKETHDLTVEISALQAANDQLQRRVDRLSRRDRRSGRARSQQPPVRRRSRLGRLVARLRR